MTIDRILLASLVTAISLIKAIILYSNTWTDSIPKINIQFYSLPVLDQRPWTGKM